MHLNGFKIYGGAEKVIEICKKTGAGYVIISTTSIDENKEEELRKKLNVEHIRLGRFSIQLKLN